MRSMRSMWGETEVSDAGDEPGGRRTVVVGAGAKEKDAGGVFREV
jgi:hypothetical protein